MLPYSWTKICQHQRLELHHHVVTVGDIWTCDLLSWQLGVWGSQGDYPCCPNNLWCCRRINHTDCPETYPCDVHTCLQKAHEVIEQRGCTLPSDSAASSHRSPLLIMQTWCGVCQLCSSTQHGNGSVNYQMLQAWPILEVVCWWHHPELHSDQPFEQWLQRILPMPICLSESLPTHFCLRSLLQSMKHPHAIWPFACSLQAAPICV